MKDASQISTARKTAAMRMSRIPQVCTKSLKKQGGIIFFLVSVFLIHPLRAGYRDVTGEPDSPEYKSALNQNFKRIDRDIANKIDFRQTRYKIGTFSTRTTNGNQSVTGIGFKPRLVIFSISDGASQAAIFSLGAATEDDQANFFSARTDDTDSGGTVLDSSYVFKRVGGDAS